MNNIKNRTTTRNLNKPSPLSDGYPDASDYENNYATQGASKRPGSDQDAGFDLRAFFISLLA